MKLTNRDVAQGVCEKIINGLRFTWKNLAIKIPQSEKQKEEQEDIPSVLSEEDDYAGKH